jgi:hypothetical protein
MEEHPSISGLYPDLSEEELREAENNLERYLGLILQIFERMESENEQDGTS